MSTDKVLKFGRGGAGNVKIVKDSQEASERHKYSKDVEAQDRKAIVDAILENRAPATFAHTGRGGAGNYYSPVNAPKLNEPEPADIIGSTGRRPSVLGRGGIGNFEAAKPAPKIVEDGSRSAALDTEVAQDADEQVRSPERAFLGEGRYAERDDV